MKIVADGLDLSIVIVSWNVKDLLRNCLKSIYAQTQTMCIEVFVVDNSSPDGSADMVEEEFPMVKLVRNDKNVGFAKANNQAIRESAGKYVLLLNPDTVVMDDALANMVLFMESHVDVGAVGPIVLNPDSTVQMACGRHFPTVFTEFCRLTRIAELFPDSRVFGRSMMSYWSHRDTREVDVLSGACMMVRRQVIDHVGLMDERMFLFAEEPDWCYRMRERGWKTYLNADAKIIHFRGQSMKRSSVNTELEVSKSMHLFFMKHYGWLSASSYRATLFVLTGLRIPVHWTRGRLGDMQRSRVPALMQIMCWAIDFRR